MWLIVLLVFLLIVLLIFFGPIAPTSYVLKRQNLPDDLDEYLRETESEYVTRPECEKVIDWFDEHNKQPTAISVVYLHGFSASRKELYPVPKQIAKELGANIFYTRLTGHGLNGDDAMDEGSVNAWVNDAEEAMAIGRRLGEKVVVIGMSTGATLATWLASYERAHDVLAYIMVAPNYGLTDRRAAMLTWPLAKYFVPFINGKYHSLSPINDMHGKYWDLKYPSTVLIALMSLVKLVNDQDLSEIKQPVLFISSPHDDVVDVKLIQQKFDEVGTSTKQHILVDTTNSQSQHVIAGNVFAPENNETLVQATLDFIQELQLQSTLSKTERR